MKACVKPLHRHLNIPVQLKVKHIWKCAKLRLTAFPNFFANVKIRIQFYEGKHWKTWH